MKNFKLPSVYSLLLILTTLIAVASWWMPVGRYDRVIDPTLQREVTVPDSFRYTEAKPQGFGDVVLAPISGFYDAHSYKANAIDIALFVIVVGGFIGMLHKTAVLNKCVQRLTAQLKGREGLLIPILMSAFIVIGSTGAMYEESLPLFAILVPVFLNAGFARITAVAVIFLGINIGVIGSTINPFVTIIASGAAHISFYEGFWSRLLLLVVASFIAIAWTMRHAAQHRSTALSVTEETATTSALTWREISYLLIFLSAYGVMFAGVLLWQWWMPQMTAVFLVASIILALIVPHSETESIQSFLAGASELLGVALVIGLARGVAVIMDNSQITDTILYHTSIALQNCSEQLFIQIIYYVEFFLSIFVPSSSGLAVLSMPILAPLADIVQVPRDAVVSAYQYANGMMNVISPTNATLVGSLMLAGVSLKEWWRFIFPLMLILSVLIGIGLAIAVAM